MYNRQCRSEEKSGVLILKPSGYPTSLMDFWCGSVEVRSQSSADTGVRAAFLFSSLRPSVVGVSIVAPPGHLWTICAHPSSRGRPGAHARLVSGLLRTRHRLTTTPAGLGATRLSDGGGTAATDGAGSVATKVRLIASDGAGPNWLTLNDNRVVSETTTCRTPAKRSG